MTNRVPNVDNMFYHFSNEEEGEDAILDRAFDRWLYPWSTLSIQYATYWEKMPLAKCLGAGVIQCSVAPIEESCGWDNIGLALTATLHNAIEAELHRQQRPAHHFVNFALTAHGFMHAYQTGNFTVGELLQWTARLDEWLAKLASKLNSNESFDPECGFQGDVVFVSMPGLGSGRGNRYNPGRRCLD